MEAVGLLGILGLGYAVANLSSNTKSMPNPPISMKDKPSSLQEAFQSPSPSNGLEGRDLKMVATGVTPRGAKQQLDQYYKTPSGQTLPSEINPGPQGSAFGYASEKPPTQEQVLSWSPAPEALDSATSQVIMNPAGFEADPTYVEGEFVTSPLTGQRMKADEFTHNNMTPFFGGRVRQNVAPNTNAGILDSYTGAGTTQIAKKEVETMFNTAQTPYGNPFGLEASAEFVQSRVNVPRNRAGERPFEPVRVAPAIKEKFGSTGKGGFQQTEINDYMMSAMRKTDDLRTADKPKLTYDRPMVPGQHYVADSAHNPGEVRKYKPDGFFIDNTGERFVGAFAQDAQKEMVRSIQVLKHTARPETSVEYEGPAASQAFGESYVVGSYRTPMAQQYGGAGYRNADMTSYYTENTDAAEADYGRSSIEIRPNERAATGERVMGLNLAPAETGAVAVHYNDEARPSRREEISGNIRQTGTPVGYAGGAPAVTVWDPNDVARTTVKEGTVYWGYYGVASAADAPTRLKVYDPDDIAKPTQKSQLSAKSEYYGPSISVNKDFTSHDAAYNMRTNPTKEQIARGRKPLAGNGNIAVFTGEKNGVTYRKLDADSVNDRANAVNRVTGIPTGVGDIGQVKYRAPLKLDISLQRNTPDMVAAVEGNPLQQSLRRNADHDENLLQEMLRGM
jgi:hypothetical protein